MSQVAFSAGAYSGFCGMKLPCACFQISMVVHWYPVLHVLSRLERDIVK